MRTGQNHNRSNHGGNPFKCHGNGFIKPQTMLIVLLSTLLLAYLYGCTHTQASDENKPEKYMQPAKSPAGNDANRQTTDPYVARAQELAQQGEAQKALSYLDLAQVLRPEDQKIAAEIDALQAFCRQTAAKHYKQGVENFRQNNFDEARRHFLIVLRHDPENQKALNYLRERLIPANYRSYKVQPGDNLKLIAKKVYEDPGKDFLVAFFNDLNIDQQPTPGTWLKIPHLEAEFAEPFFDVKGELARAQSALQREQYGVVVGISSKILEYDYLNKEAAVIRNEAYLQMGLRLVRQNKYEAAMKMFGKVDDDHAGLTVALQDAHKQELQRSEALLQAKDYTNALVGAKLVLEYDPSNAKAGELLNRIVCDQGNALVEEQKYKEAMEALAQGDARSYCISETKAAIEIHLKKQAEEHYLQGVKYFLLEDLQQAINEWEIAVTLDPEHEKARSGIQNARHLLEQLDKVE